MKKPNNRVYRPWWEWECYRSGFYETTAPNGIDKIQAEAMYRDFLSDLDAFGRGMDRVFREWPNSCEQFLTNTSMNRIAWLGQAAMCITTGVPSVFRSGFRLLTHEQQKAADDLAACYLEKYENSRKNK